MLEKIIKNFRKLLDNVLLLWYNKGTKEQHNKQKKGNIP